MIRAFLIFLTLIFTDLYFFPIELKAFPGVNSKMVLAAIGLVWCLISLPTHNKSRLDSSFFILSAWAALVSLIAFISITVNNTFDNTYVFYIVSMWVWLGGAYFVVKFIHKVHGRISVELVVFYLLAVCVSQCAIALIMNAYNPLRLAVDNILGGEAFMRGFKNRIYGIGAALDVAGLRFAGVLALTGFVGAHVSGTHANRRFALLLFCFFFVFLTGSFIGRSTIIGAAVGAVYWILSAKPLSNKSDIGWRWVIVGGMLLLGTAAVIILYHKSQLFHESFRFGFEGFFSMAETGEFQTNSTDILQNMVIWPETAHTWIIGDGYMENPSFMHEIGPYYTGQTYGGFYKGTDIGYLRFIFYFGIVGLLAFIAFFIAVFRQLSIKFPPYRMMFLLLLAVNFIGWMKVSTDLFLLFAPFLCISSSSNSNALRQ